MILQEIALFELSATILILNRRVKAALEDRTLAAVVAEVAKTGSDEALDGRTSDTSELPCKGRRMQDVELVRTDSDEMEYEAK